MSARDRSPGDERREQIAALYAEHAPGLQSSLAGQLGDPHLAEEALATAWAKLLERPDIDPQTGLGWLYTVARNQGYEIGRDAARASSIDIPVSVDAHSRETVGDLIAGPDDLAAQAEDRERLSGLDHAKPDQRRALLMRAAGYSYAEISQQTGFTHTKVNRSLTEGRALLRQREAQIERSTQEHIDTAHAPPGALEAEVPVSTELEQRQQRINRRRHRAEVELAVEIDR